MQSALKIPALLFISFIIVSTSFAAKKDVETETFNCRYDVEIMELKEKTDKGATFAAKGLSLILTMTESKGLLNKDHLETMATTAKDKIPNQMERNGAVDLATSLKPVAKLGDFSGFVVKTELSQYGVAMTNHFYILSNGDKVFTVSAAIEASEEEKAQLDQVELLISSLKLK